MDEQRRVAAFLADNDMESPPAFRLLDLVSELGEVAKEVNESTEYGSNPDDISVAEDELGDMLFALLALADSVDVDAGAALETAISKYEARIAEKGDASSGAS